MRIGDTIFFAVIILALLMFVYLLVGTGVAVVAEARCLEQGYPKSATSIFLDSYCMNLDGATRGKVVPLD